MSEDPAPLNPSKLGTKEYWESFYSLEKDNFIENSNDTGESWFSDSGAEEKMVDFLTDVAEGGDEGKITFDSSIVDLGTGNGQLLFALKEAGFNGELTGLDYSQKAVEFSTLIAKSHDIDNVVFEQCDILTDSLQKKWDIVLDKGTLDAIALSSETYDGIAAVQRYASAIKNIVVDNGIVLITSCNFTQQELINLITTGTKHKLKVWKHIAYKVFEFGGNKGQSICSVAFTPSS